MMAVGQRCRLLVNLFSYRLMTHGCTSWQIPLICFHTMKLSYWLLSQQIFHWKNYTKGTYLIYLFCNHVQSPSGVAKICHKYDTEKDTKNGFPKMAPRNTKDNQFFSQASQESLLPARSRQQPITLTSHTNAFFSACARYFKDDDDNAVEYNESDDDDEDHSHITYQCIFLSLC